MKKLYILKLALFGILFSHLFNTTDSYAQCRGNLIFSDEFNGTALDLTKWTIDQGNGCPNLCGWGNNEQQFYTNSSQNVSVSGGYLTLTARYAPNYNGTGSNFTSGKVLTRNKFDRLYGRFEARMKMPRGTGLWPAFWMLPTDNVYGGWPTSGEIDIMEYRGDRTNVSDATLHYGAAWPNNRHDGTSYTLPTGNFADEFHIFAVDWQPGIMRFYVDGILIKTETENPNSLNPASNHSVTWPWNQRFFIILNLALGGWYSGNPTTEQIVSSTTWPQTFQIDYVRVYDMAQSTAQTPYLNNVRSIPGTIQAEHYNEGCNGTAYNDVTPSNEGGQLRQDWVGIEQTTDAGGGHNVGWTAAGEWLNYNVNIANPGTYTLQVRVAAATAGRSMRVEMDGVNISGTINVPNTGGWQTWQTVTIGNINLTAGPKVMRIHFMTEGINLNWVNFVANTTTTSPTITFNNVSRTYGDPQFAMTATSNSPGAITYSITSGSQYATITSAGMVTITGAGSVTVLATQQASGSYSSGTATATLTINPANLTITSDNKTKVYNTANPPLTVTYSGFVYGQNSSVLTTQPTVSTTATPTSNVGNYPITVTGGSAANYTITRVNGTLTITQATPTLTYNGATSGQYGATIALSATSNSTGAISYTATNGTGSANVSGSNLQLTGAGTVTLNITVAATTNYTARTINQTITVSKSTSAGLAYTGLTSGNVGGSIDLSSTSQSTGAITYSIAGGTGSGYLEGNRLFLTGEGTIILQITVEGDNNYAGQTISETINANYVLGANKVAIADLIEIFPVPATDYAEIKFFAKNYNQAELTVYDMRGYNVLETISISTQEGYRLSTLDLPSGIYTVMIKTSEGTAVKKLVK
ncbi:MAG: carbohydrate-binding protein [Cytophagaceae bacterium]